MERALRQDEMQAGPDSERFKPEGGTPTLDPPPKTAYLT